MSSKTVMILATVLVMETLYFFAQAGAAYFHSAVAENQIQNLQELKSKVDMAERIAQARELLGDKYGVTVKHGQAPRHMNHAIHEYTRTRIRGVSDPKRVSRAILLASRRHHFDPVFILAVIERESRFVPTMVGEHGEIGLMQIRPSTAEWIAHKFRLPWRGPEMLMDPVANIRIGAAYLSFLRESFKSKGGLYLSAYNMGPKRTRENLGRNVYPSIYAGKVLEHYIRLHSELTEMAQQSEILNPTPSQRWKLAGFSLSWLSVH